MTKTILIVDDAAVMRQVLSITLRQAGFAVIEAVNGKDALEKLEGNKIEMVVTDINMPEMDGIEFIKQLRMKDGYKFTPVVTLTTLSQESKKEEGRQAGASGWLCKPFNAKQLLETVRKFVT